MTRLLQRPRFSIAEKSARGFTLTEVAIVLGIAGLLIGAIWVAGSIVSQNNKIRLAEQETITILQNYRGLWGLRGIDYTVDPSGDYVTCTGVSNGYFPAEMNNTAACSNANSNTWPINPWGGSTGVVMQQSTQIYGIIFNSVPINACSALGQHFANIPGINNLQINGGQLMPPVSASQIRTLCNQAVNNIAAEYTLNK